MEIDLKNVARPATHFDVTRAIAKVLHSPDFAIEYNILQKRPINFLVTLTPDSVPNSIRNNGTGTLTLPYVEFGKNFLDYIHTRRIKIKVLKSAISFFESTRTPRFKTIRTLKTVPYQDPSIVEAKDDIIKSLLDQICVRKIQLGVFRKKSAGLIFSTEWEQDYTFHGDARLAFEYEHQLLRLKTGDHTDTVSYSLVVTFANLKEVYIGWEVGNPFILFHLTTPPALESESMHRPLHNNQTRIRFRRRVDSFDEAHRRVAPYAHQLMLILKDGDDLSHFSFMCGKAGIPIPIQVPDGAMEISSLNIFSHNNLLRLEKWLETLEWTVAFQCKALLCNLRLSAIELLELKPKIETLAQSGSRYASEVLRHLHTVMRSSRGEDADSAFARAVAETVQLAGRRASHGSGFFNARHVSFTPTAMRLEGPYTQQSNTVLREYIDYQEFFVRVDFRDEDGLHYRWDREVDGATFVRERVGEILKNGFTIAGRKFEFLAYSQSQLRAHSVYFVASFKHPQNGWVTASKIRDELGVFDNIIQFPALYAARISQAFSGTEASVRLHSDEWEEIDDIKHDDRIFTNGVGTVSRDLAEWIWRRLCEGRRTNSSGPFTPVAFQIRFGGYKGMVAVDPRLTGIKMRLRPSMKKFEVYNREEIPLEIARAFQYPGRMYLNRPLIQIMEDLGVPKESFMDLQDAAVADVLTGRYSLTDFAKLLDSHGLGKSFSLSYIMRRLDEIGCDFEHCDPSKAVTTSFIRGVVDTAVVSALRDMKHKARIPVLQGWNLVGIADEGSVLREGEIYACVWEQGMEEPIFLEGPVVISRSPTIHTGDVRMVRAIGRPPPGSIFDQEPLPNVVVFPCEGRRDLASCLAGGDLDGDLYLVCQYPSLALSKCHPPGDYPPTERMDLHRPSTIEDVADFVVEYINSDMVGLLSTNHLILSDQSSFGTRDHGCLKLAELCSKAVDFPKSGIPVDMKDVPRFLIPYKPDWKSDEVNNPRQTDYYVSTRAIGYLYRAINLGKNMRELSFDPKTSNLKENPRKSEEPTRTVDAITVTVGSIVERYISTSPTLDVMTEIQDLFLKYSIELKYMCLTYTLSHDPDSRLREEEIVLGTILAKCTQARWRATRTDQMRMNANELVSLISLGLGAADGSGPVQRLVKGWAAWQYAQANRKEFGHNSFGLIGLETIFRALEDFEGTPMWQT